MPYNERELAVLRKYEILWPAGRRSPDGTVMAAEGPRQCYVEGDYGPLMAPEVVQRLIDADTTPDQKWLDWIFFQAGGGEKAVKERGKALSFIKNKYLSERTGGFQHPETHAYVQPISQEKAEARWAKAEPHFLQALTVGGQDEVNKLDVFGYNRNWPGKQRRYEYTVASLTNFLAAYPKLVRMNKEMLRAGKETLPTEPTEIATFMDMDEVVKKVNYYFRTKEMRTDFQTSAHPARDDGLIFSDDYITAMSPLTWATAVKYGYSSWAWANPDTFDRVLSKPSHDYENVWMSQLQRGHVYVYLTFNVPVPGWISAKHQVATHYGFTNLALELEQANMADLGNMDDLAVWDEENRHTLTVGQVKDAIRAEVTRDTDPANDPNPDQPIKQGGRVVQSPEEAEEIIQHLDAALRAVAEWAAQFDVTTLRPGDLNQQ